MEESVFFIVKCRKKRYRKMDLWFNGIPQLWFTPNFFVKTVFAGLTLLFFFFFRVAHYNTQFFIVVGFLLHSLYPKYISFLQRHCLPMVIKKDIICVGFCSLKNLFTSFFCPISSSSPSSSSMLLQFFSFSCKKKDERKNEKKKLTVLANWISSIPKSFKNQFNFLLNFSFLFSFPFLFFFFFFLLFVYYFELVSI